MYINIHSAFQALCDGVDISSQSDQEAPQSSSMPKSALDNVLEQLNAQVELGKIDTAWQPCPLLKFELKIEHLSEQELEQRCSNVIQASSPDINIILGNLQKWRDKYLKAERLNNARDMEKYRSGVEALRARARLMFLQQNGKAWEEKLKRAKVSSGWHGL